MTHSPLLLQLVVILGTARLLGLLLRYFGQAAVVGEMAAGFVLGPVDFRRARARAARPHLSAGKPGHARAACRSSAWCCSCSSSARSCDCRAACRASCSQRDASGCCRSSCRWRWACPWQRCCIRRSHPRRRVLAVRAVHGGGCVDHRVSGHGANSQRARDDAHDVGRLALTGAAVADVLAWVMLAAVVILASSAGDWTQLARTVGGLGALIAVLFLAVKPLLAHLIQRYAADRKPQGALLATLLIGTFASAYITDWLGVHAVFGAFVFGACLPRDDRLLAALIERIEYVAILVLMPIFFALAGLSTTADAFVGASLGALLLILARRDRRQDRRQCGRRAHRRSVVARVAGGRLAHECARHDGADRHQGRAGHRRDRPGPVHDADGDGDRDDRDDRAAAHAVRGAGVSITAARPSASNSSR